MIFLKTDEQNFNLDEQQDLEAKERQALVQGKETLQRDKRDADEQVNNDQKSDDEEIALQQGKTTKWLVGLQRILRKIES
jgi:hypothetical protein